MCGSTNRVHRKYSYWPFCLSTQNSKYLSVLFGGLSRFQHYFSYITKKARKCAATGDWTCDIRFQIPDANHSTTADTCTHNITQVMRTADRHKHMHTLWQIYRCHRKRMTLCTAVNELWGNERNLFEIPWFV